MKIDWGENLKERIILKEKRNNNDSKTYKTNVKMEE